MTARRINPPQDSTDGQHTRDLSVEETNWPTIDRTCRTCGEWGGREGARVDRCAHHSSLAFSGGSCWSWREMV